MFPTPKKYGTTGLKYRQRLEWLKSMDSPQQPFSQTQTPTRLGLSRALVVSLGIHLLLLWWLAYHASGLDRSAEKPQDKKTIRLKLQWLSPVVPEPPLARDTPAPKPLAPPLSKPENRQPEKPTATRTANYPIHAPAHQPRPTTQDLLRSANQVAREIAKAFPETSDPKRHKDTTSVSARLDRALNPRRKTPGVSVLADGTTRVVTEGGYSYCIKPLDDGQILDPGDDMRVMMYCP
jgi:outer membrane biosynthesis protein TonB